MAATTPTDRGMKRPHPPRSDASIAENLQSLAASIAICRSFPDPNAPGLVPALTANSRAIVRAVFDAPESAWQLWDKQSPTLADGQTIGRDKRGYYHIATHLAGTDGLWAIRWMSVPFPETSEQGGD
jgi:hypothetical protein